MLAANEQMTSIVYIYTLQTVCLFHILNETGISSAGNTFLHVGHV